MKRRRERTIAVGLAVVAAAVAVGAAVVLWPWIVETYWLRALGRGDDATRRRAALALGDLGSLRAIPVLARVRPTPLGVHAGAMSDHIRPQFQNDARLVAIWRIVEGRPEAVVRPLLGVLEGPDSSSRRVAAWALIDGFLGTLHGPAPSVYRPKLLPGPGEGDSHVLPRGWVPLFAAMLRDDDLELRRVAASVLPSAGPDSVPTLAGALSHADSAVRAQSLLGMSRFPEAAAPHADAVLPLLSDEDELVRSAAARCLGAIAMDRADVVEAVRSARDMDPDEEVRAAASGALGSAAPPAEPPALGSSPDAAAPRTRP